MSKLISLKTFIVMCVFLSTILKPSYESITVNINPAHVLNVQEYCAIPSCPHGEHTLCLYNPVVHGNHGPDCNIFYEHAKITEEIASKILKQINTWRSNVATGKEKLADNYSPTAYGMMKLTWDNELATIAQLWANQCIARKDFCRSTKRFPNVEQIVDFKQWWLEKDEVWNGLVEISAAQKDYIVPLQILEDWHSKKNTVTEEDMESIENLPLQKKYYLMLMMSNVTHIGCGLTLNTEYSRTDNSTNITAHKQKFEFLVKLALVCNINYARESNNPIINTKKPESDDLTRSKTCGCPTGTLEEADTCLCQLLAVDGIDNDDNNGREKNMVLLPIISNEDSSSSKVPENKFSERANNQINHIEPEKFAGGIRNSIFGNKVTIDKKVTNQTNSDYLFRQRTNSKKAANTGTRNPKAGNHRLNSLTVNTIHPKEKTRQQASVFEILQNESFQSQHKEPLIIHTNKRTKSIPFRMDVALRRNFDEVKKMTNDYLKALHRNLSQKRNKQYFDTKNQSLFHQVLENEKKEFNSTFLNKNDNRNLTNKFYFTDSIAPTGTHTYSRNIGIDDDNRKDRVLMKLLDLLEQEVNNIGLEFEVKQVLNTIIGKIHEHIEEKQQNHRKQEEIVRNKYVSKYASNKIELLSRDNYKYDDKYDTRLILRPSKVISFNNNERHVDVAPRNQDHNREQLIRRKNLQDKLEHLEKEVHETARTLQTLKHSDVLQNYGNVRHKLRPIISTHDENPRTVEQYTQEHDHRDTRDIIYSYNKARIIYGY